MKKRIEQIDLLLQNISPQKFFLFVALFFGILYALINPIFQAPDEHSHYYRAAGMANGYLLPNVENNRAGTKVQSGSIELFKYYDLNNQISKGTYRYQIKKMLALPLGSFQEKFLIVSTTLYTPVSYLPQIFIYFISSLLRLNPLVIFILVRLAGLVAWTILIYFAIKIIPKGKWVLATLALLPISLFMASVVSADTITNGLAFLAIGMIFASVASPKILTKKFLVCLLVTIILLALAKQGMAVVSLLILLLPTPRYFNKSKFRFIKISSVLLAFALSALWQAYISPVASLLTLEGTSSSKQIAFLLANPLRIFKVTWNTYFNFGSDNIYLSFFIALGMLNVVLPVWIGIAWTIALVKSFGQSVGAKKDLLKLWQKLYFAAVAFGLFAAITLAIYLTWTRPGQDHVDGLQGRYFLPVLAILIPALTSKRAEPSSGAQKYLVLFILILEIATLVLFTFYYRYHLVY